MTGWAPHPSLAPWWIAVPLWLGCRAPASVIPAVGLEPVDEAGLVELTGNEANDWVAALLPGEALRFDTRWLARTAKRSGEGRAVIRFAPPDSLRVDYRGPLRRSGSVVIVGDRVLWADTDEDLERLVSVPFLVWAALGIPRPPPVGAAVTGHDKPGGRVWRYSWRDTSLIYELRTDPDQLFTARLTSLGRLLGIAHSARRASVGLVRGQTALAEDNTVLSFAVTSVAPRDSSRKEPWFSRGRQPAGGGDRTTGTPSR